MQKHKPHVNFVQRWHWLLWDGLSHSGNTDCEQQTFLEEMNDVCLIGDTKEKPSRLLLSACPPLSKKCNLKTKACCLQDVHAQMDVCGRTEEEEGTGNELTCLQSCTVPSRACMWNFKMKNATTVPCWCTPWVLYTEMENICTWNTSLLGIFHGRVPFNWEEMATLQSGKSLSVQPYMLCDTGGGEYQEMKWNWCDNVWHILPSYCLQVDLNSRCTTFKLKLPQQVLHLSRCGSAVSGLLICGCIKWKIVVCSCYILQASNISLVFFKKKKKMEQRQQKTEKVI